MLTVIELYIDCQVSEISNKNYITLQNSNRNSIFAKSKFTIMYIIGKFTIMYIIGKFVTYFTDILRNILLMNIEKGKSS